MSGFLNLGSIVLGLIAWAVPILAIKWHDEKGKTIAFGPISLGFCAASLILQFYEIRHRVHIEDWSAIMDTIDVLAGVAVAFSAITLLLNLLAAKAVKPADDAQG